MIEQSRWKRVENTRSQIIKAGKTVRKDTVSDLEVKDAVEIIDNWRMAHAFPLHVIYTHLRRFKNYNSSIIVAERLKRLDSIVGKLKRETSMNLWTMQDLGGCRVIVPTIDDVYYYANRYEESRKRHIKRKEYDYIKNPKKSGYRSLHVVYEYKSDRTDYYNTNMLIEVQFRTHMQHLWATAVETMGIFTKKAIKSGQGDREINRFFALTSTLIALQEGMEIVPDTSNDIKVLKKEIYNLNTKNKYLEFLDTIKVVTKLEEENKKNYTNGYCILALDYNTNQLSIKRYRPSEIEIANEYYNLLENEHRNDGTDAVLVRVSSFAELQSAYPNYFSDISEFVALIKIFLR